MKSFAERDPLRIGAVAIMVIVLLLVGASRVDDLPFIGAGDEYAAQFSDANGISRATEVQVAGVRVGKVDKIELHGDHVTVHFTIEEDLRLGEETSAAIQVGSLLGQPYVEIRPSGAGTLDAGSVIPQERTEPAYDLVSAVSELTSNTQEIKVARVAEAFDTLSATFRGSPKALREAIDGLSDFSSMLAARDQDLLELLDHANGVSGVLNRHRGDVTELLRSSNLLLDELRSRREVIHQLLVNTSRLSQHLSGLVRENQAAIGPALRDLAEVVDLLKERRRNLGRGIEQLTVYARTFNNLVGTGPWFDNVFVNLLPPPAGSPTRPRETR